MTESGRFAFEGLDRMIHERARLGIMTSLMMSPDGIPFPELKELCDLTDGNLSRHLKVLTEGGLVELNKSGSGRTKQTLVQMTTQGREQFLRYLTELKSVVEEASTAAEHLPTTGKVLPAPGA
ncbi:Helix-turn-helix domain protein [Thalassoglobus neptunius]|uniref:Helix-turn-helix domain protein n=1 Tax=Thalassoglobus neptunius TaxID=1938619 RepID=A0A5C5WE17_9PLAN|nr:transcriptional regulator [Thalassoglobus neptunius]TWT47962.1 Helix-turn-helix domain protein [Thalassoglobus neptunius]